MLSIWKSFAVLIRNTFIWIIFALTTHLQTFVIKLWLRKWYTLYSMYLRLIDVYNNNILNLLQQLHETFLLLGYRHTKKKFEESFLEENIFLFTHNEPTHYHIQTESFTTVELSLSSWDCYLDCNDKILSSLHGMDGYSLLLDRTMTQDVGKQQENWETRPKKPNKLKKFSSKKISMALIKKLKNWHLLL